MRDVYEQLRVRETIEHYFYGVDAKDLDALRQCFRHDAQAHYHQATPDEMTVVGGCEIADGIFVSCSRFTSSNHAISNLIIDLAEDNAEANTFAVAYVMVGSEALVRGLRYQDHLVRELDGWRIHHRVHTPLWQMSGAAIPPKFF